MDYYKAKYVVNSHSIELIRTGAHHSGFFSRVLIISIMVYNGWCKQRLVYRHFSASNTQNTYCKYHSQYSMIRNTHNTDTCYRIDSSGCWGCGIINLWNITWISNKSNIHIRSSQKRPHINPILHDLNMLNIRVQLRNEDKDGPYQSSGKSVGVK